MVAFNPPHAKFPLGQCVATPGALAAITEAGQTPSEFIYRHAHRDWGEVPPEDKLANDDALKDGSRILSAYVLKTGVKIWLITEAADEKGHREATTILLPDEY
jgi:hypothetical protein